MVGHEGSSAGSYLADRTSPIPSHCASIVVTNTLRVDGLYDRSSIVFDYCSVKKPFRCKCGKTYKSASGLRHHSMIHHANGDFTPCIKKKLQQVLYHIS